MKTRVSSHSKIKFTLERGLPSMEFIKEAWASEPLTTALKETNIPLALPGPDNDISLVAIDEDKNIIGQCSANRVVKYWEHVNKADDSKENLSTKAFIKIHKKAIEDEQKYISKADHSSQSYLHNAGIAVLPKHRGNKIGFQMTTKQMEICSNKKVAGIFCETTNLFSAAIVEKIGFEKIAAYPYKDLAIELSQSELTNINDSFTVWCRKL